MPTLSSGDTLSLDNLNTHTGGTEGDEASIGTIYNGTPSGDNISFSSFTSIRLVQLVDILMGLKKPMKVTL